MERTQERHSVTLRHSTAKMLIPIALLMVALALAAPLASANVRSSQASVMVLAFARAAGSIQPPSAAGTISVNTQTGTVGVSLQGFTPGTTLQLLFAGIGSVVLGPVTVDLSGNGAAGLTIPPGQYSGSFELVSLGLVQMITSQVTFTVGLTSTTTTTTTTTPGQPPGLVSGWATSNVAVMSTTYPQTLTLNGGVVVTLSSISIVSSTNAQIIENVAYNQNTVQVQFSHDGGTELVISSSARPVAVYADAQLLAQASSSAGLTFNSNACVRPEQCNTHRLRRPI